MTPDNAIIAIKGQLGNWTGTNIDTWCLNEMNAAVRRLERGLVLPWFLEEDTTSLVTVAGTETVALPSDFLREDEDAEIGPLFKKNSDGKWKELRKEDYSVAVEKYPEAGEPKVYAIRGSNIYLRPIPTAVYELRLLYYAKDATIAAGSTETTWLIEAPDLIIALAGRALAGQYLRDDKAEQRFAQRAGEELDLLNRAITARQETGRRRQLGG